MTIDWVGGPQNEHPGTDNPGPGVPWSIYAPYVTWSYNPSLNNAAGVANAGIKIAVYTDPNRFQPTDPGYSSLIESDFAHDCSGQRIWKPYNGSVQYLMDPHSAHLTSVWRDVVNANMVWARFDMVVEDDTNIVDYIGSAYGGGGGSPCGYSASDWTAASNSAIATLGYPVMASGLYPPYSGGTFSISPTINITSAFGLWSEDCYASNNLPRLAASDNNYWQSFENTEIQMAARGQFFGCLQTDWSPADQNLSQRLYVIASFLLTYNLGTSAIFPQWDTPSRFHVLPETQLVPLNPLVSPPGDVSGLRLATGVFGREYASCYYAGSPVGACAIVVNPDPYSSYAYPYGGKYTKTFVISGSGVLDGGTASTTGAPPPPAVPPLTSLIVFQ